MTTRTTCLAIAAMLVVPAAAAHDFWIEPDSYDVGLEQAVPIRIYVGHGKDKTDWPIAAHRVVGLRSAGPDGLKSHTSGPESLDGDVSLRFETPGLHMVFIETTNSYSSLPAQKFNAYVEEEGIRPIAAHRLVTGAVELDGTELYSRRGKALVQVGCRGTGELAWSTPLGLTLEIIPLHNPFDWDQGEPLAVEVQYHGQPVASATLHVTQLGGAGQTFTLETDGSGKADLSARLNEGRWLVHTVWSEPARGLLQQADYQTVFSSLTFETGTNCN